MTSKAEPDPGNLESALWDIAKRRARRERFRGVERSASMTLATAFDDATRKRVVDALVHILRSEDDAVVRSQAVEAFEEGNDLNATVEGARCALWLKTQTKLARSMHVIFSDDDAQLLKFLGNFVSEGGWKKISLSEDPEETVRLAQQLHPALVVSDMNKPIMSGAQMARILKANASTREIPILLLSAWAFRNLKEDEVLFCGILSKPFSPKRLMHAAEMAIAGKYPD